jgi:hypothetical protein
VLDITLTSEDVLVSLDRKGAYDLLAVPNYRIELIVRLPSEELPMMMHKVQECWEREIIQARLQGLF